MNNYHQFILNLFTFAEVETRHCGTGSEMTDANDFIEFTSKTVTFPADPAAGSTQQTVDIYINDDNGIEDYENEIFCVDLQQTASGADSDQCPISNRGELAIPRTVEVTILNDDSEYSLS